MRRAIFLILLALGIIAVLLFIYNPDLLEKIWLWIVGLVGVIVSAVKNLVNSVIEFFKKDKEEEEREKAVQQPATAAIPEEASVVPIRDPQQEVQLQQKNAEIADLKGKIAELEKTLSSNKRFDDFRGTTVTVLRYFNDNETTLGLLFVEGEFFCYTLEDAPRDVKVKGKTRIPQGNYKLGFNVNDTPLTEKYRETRPWFQYHLHVKNVPNFQYIYIHVGNTIKDTEGCLLVADSINSSSAKRSIYNSREAFRRLYQKLKPIIDRGDKVRIKYYDEDWFQRFNLKRIVA